MRDRGFTHPNFGKEVRIEQTGREVRLIFVADTISQAEGLADDLNRQAKNGAINLTMMGKPTSIYEI